MHIYLISGLGADERVFHKLKLLETHPHTFIQWIPFTKNESLANYALRLTQQMNNDTSNDVLIGLSFGGMLATEISKIKNFKKVILLSSVWTYKNIPLTYRLLGNAIPLSLVPIGLSKKFKWAFHIGSGVKTKADMQLINQVIDDTDSNFLRDATNCIVKWKNEQAPSNYLHIHGTKDLILPCPKHPNIFKVENAGHLMILTHVKQVNAAILKSISSSKEKIHSIKAEDIIQLIENAGACIATDRITIDNAKLNYMYREEYDSNRPSDTGWRFFSGDESDEYLNELSNSNIYSLNTIANYEPAILEYLNTEAPCKFQRIEGTNRFERIE